MDSSSTGSVSAREIVYPNNTILYYNNSKTILLIIKFLNAMKKLFVIITLVMSGFVFNACTDEADDVTPQIEVDEVTAPEGGSDDQGDQ